MTRVRASGSLCLVLLVPGAAVGSAHGLATVSSPDTTAPAPPSATSTPAQVAPAVSLSRWDAAVDLGSRPATARPMPAVATTPMTVPLPALGAYHRAAAVLAVAAPVCGLDWSLLAAVGHVESGHGQRTGTGLDEDGVARPAIVGPAIDGRRGGPLPDTDGGELDGRTGQDRAVGPMQLLPSIWAAAAVDGDGDGLRDPQDVDDAALAAGVLLCRSAPEAGSPTGRRQALRQYNAAPGYVDLVQRLAAAYARTAVPPSVDAHVGAAPEAVLASDARGDGPVSGRSATPAEAAGTTRPAPLSSRPGAARSRSAAPGPGADPTASPTAVSAPVVDPEAEEPPRVEPVSEPTEHQESGPAEEPAAEPETTQSPQPTEEQTSEPTAETTAETTSEPTPSDTPEPGPVPTSEDESPEPPPTDATDAAEAAEDPAVIVTGVWAADDAGQFLLDGTLVDVEGLGDLTAPAPEDLDGDGSVEDVGDELEGLGGSTLEVVGIATGPNEIVIGSPDDLRPVTPSP